MEVRLQAVDERQLLTGLTCGSRYQAQLAAYNRVGIGNASHLLRFATAGAGNKILSMKKPLKG
jgi:hypothetical protein